MLRSLATLFTLAALLVLPGSALAMDGRTGGTDGSAPTSVGPVNYLRDAKYAPAPAAASRTVEVVRVVRPGGFRYRDAGIGAALTVFAIALGAGAIILTRVRHDGHATVN